MWVFASSILVQVFVLVETVWRDQRFLEQDWLPREPSSDNTSVCSRTPTGFGQQGRYGVPVASMSGFMTLTPCLRAARSKPLSLVTSTVPARIQPARI